MAVGVAGSRVREWMTVDVPVITPDTSVATALRLLREHKIPALPVWKGGRVAGMVDEKALLRFTPSEATTLDVYELREVLDRMTVARAATSVAAALSPEQDVREAGRLMRRADAEVLPVVDAGHLVGILAWSGVLEAMLQRGGEA
jgi:acetoin utilization protein AcuB